MDSIRQYLISVTAAAVICGVISGIFQKKNAYSVLIQTICGLFITIVLLSPWITFRFSDLMDDIGYLSVDSDTVSGAARENASRELQTIIKSNMESYILDKASEAGANLTVSICLEDTWPYAPRYVIITGAVSPALKQKLSRCIKQQLGISEENQVWG